MNKLSNYLIIILVFIFRSGAAQWAGMPIIQSKNLPQAVLVNPSWMQEQGFSIILPINSQYSISSSSIGVNDFFVEDNGKTFFDPTTVLNKLEKNNLFDADASIQLFGIQGIKFKSLKFGIGMGLRGNASIDYPSDLLNLAFRGNADYLGRTLEIGPAFQQQGLLDMHISVSKKVSEKLSVGGRLHHLRGLALAKTNSNQLSLFTDPNDYSIRIQSDVELLSSNIFGGAGVVDGKFQTEDVDFKNFGNPGWAIDLGANYSYSDKLSLAGSIGDVGFVSWTANANKLSSKTNQVFRGTDLSNWFSADSVGFSFNEDSIVNYFNIQGENVNGFTTTLAPLITLRADYSFNKKLDLWGMYSSRFQKVGSRHIISGGAIYKPWKFLSLMGSLHFPLGISPRVGTGIILNLGPFQIFGTTDNFLGIVQKNPRAFSASLGMNLVFKKQESTKS
jgi:hypothetical protein